MFTKYLRPISWTLVFALLVGVLPHMVMAQGEGGTIPGTIPAALAYDGSQAWYQAEIARTQQVFKSAIDQAQAAGTRQRGADTKVEGVLTGDCGFISQTNEFDPPAGSEHMVRVEETTDSAAYNGRFFFRGDARGYQRLTAWKGYDPVPGDVLFWQVAVRSSAPLLLNVNMIDAGGNATNEFSQQRVKGTGQWELFVQRISGRDYNISVSTVRDPAKSPAVELDFLSVVACDPNDVSLPYISTGGTTKANLDCGVDRTGRWRIGNESNLQIESSLFLLPGSAQNHSQNSDFVCWNRAQSYALNHSTGQKLDFMGKDRAQSMSRWLVPVAMVSATTLPFWATSLEATIGAGAVLIGTFLVAVAPWAILLGIILVIWYGWWSYLAAESEALQYALHKTTYTAPSGKKTTFYRQNFADPKSLTGTYSLYRIEDAVKNGAYESWVTVAQIVSYLAVSSEGTKGFLISEQYDASHALTNARFAFKVLERTSDTVAQEEQNVWEETHPSGPIRSEDIAAIATAIAIWLASEIIGDDNPPTDDRCLSRITPERVAADVESLDPWIEAEVLGEIIDKLILPGEAQIKYSHPQAQRGRGSSAGVTFFGHIFPDGNKKTIGYVCVKTALGRGLWVYNKIWNLEINLPHDWEE